MSDLNTFEKISALSSKSFHDQKALIKKVLAGREVKCKVCQQLLTYKLPTGEDTPTGIYCKKGCTDIALDFT